MAKFRLVHTSFWTDADVLDEFTVEDKYFYLYLLTNDHTTQLGIYSITKKQMAFELGYSLEVVNALLQRFINHHSLIRYNEQTREIAIKNWGRYNLARSGKPMIDCVKSEIQNIKDKSFIEYVAQNIANNQIKDLFYSYSRYVHDTYTTSGEEKEQEKEQEEEKEQQQEKNVGDVAFSKLINFYEQNIGQISPILSQKLGDLVDTYNLDLIIEAFTRALTAQATNKFSYANKILKNWKEKNILTIKALKASEVIFNAKHEKHERTTESSAYDNLWG